MTTPHPEGQPQDTYTDLTARLAAADLGWAHDHGDPPAAPEYIKRLAFQVMAFQPPLIAGVYVDDAMLNRMRDRLHGDRCGCGEWDSHSGEYVDRMDATIHAVLYPLRHPVRPVPPDTEDSDYRAIARLAEVLEAAEDDAPKLWHDEDRYWQHLAEAAHKAVQAEAVLAVQHRFVDQLRQQVESVGARTEMFKRAHGRMCRRAAELAAERDELLAQRTAWDRRLSDVQQEHGKAIASWDRTRARLTDERDESRALAQSNLDAAMGNARDVIRLRADLETRTREVEHWRDEETARALEVDAAGSRALQAEEERDEARTHTEEYHDRCLELTGENARLEAERDAWKNRAEKRLAKFVALADEHDALRSTAVVLPEDWRYQVAAKFGYGPRHDGELSPRALDVAELVESWQVSGLADETKWAIMSALESGTYLACDGEYYATLPDCDTCEGTGRVVECLDCGGMGKVDPAARVEAEAPAPKRLLDGLPEVVTGAVLAHERLLVDRPAETPPSEDLPTARTLHVITNREIPDIPDGHTDQRVRYEFEGDSWDGWLISYGTVDGVDEAYVMDDDGTRWVQLRSSVTEIDSPPAAPTRDEVVEEFAATWDGVDRTPPVVGVDYFRGCVNPECRCHEPGRPCERYEGHEADEFCPRCGWHERHHAAPSVQPKPLRSEEDQHGDL